DPAVALGAAADQLVVTDREHHHGEQVELLEDEHLILDARVAVPGEIAAFVFLARRSLAGMTMEGGHPAVDWGAAQYVVEVVEQRAPADLVGIDRLIERDVEALAVGQEQRI